MQIPSEILPREQGHRVFGGVARSRRLPESRLSETLTERRESPGSGQHSLLHAGDTKNRRNEEKGSLLVAPLRRSSYCNAKKGKTENSIKQEDLLAFSRGKQKPDK